MFSGMAKQAAPRGGAAMILRSISFLLCAAAAYALLHGWPAALPSVMRACVAVLVLVAGLGLWSRRAPSQPEPSARGRRRPQWLDYAALGGAVLAMECAFLWLLGSAPAPLESAGLAIERHFRPEASALRAVAETSADARPGNWLWNQQTQRPLPRRTDFKPGMKPEVFLRLQDRADAAELLRSRLYVRAFALGRYENSAWAPLAAKPLEITAEDSGFVRLAPSRAGRAILHEVFHAADPGGQNVLTALQGVTAARISPLQQMDDGLHLLPPATTVGGYQYVADSVPMRIEDLPDGSLVRSWPDAAVGLLALPESGDFAAKLRSLARTAAGVGTMKEQLLGLQNHLRTTLQYSLTSQNLRDLDPIENFLFEEKRGHCEYFATAGALMARALGIPSRVAYGWAGGTWYEASGLFVFRANEAHAWTEIWLEHHGWVLMDPTPESGGSGERAQVAPPGEAPPTAQETGNPAPAETAEHANLPLLAFWLMAGFITLAGMVALLRGRNGFRHDGDTPFSLVAGSEPPPGYLQSWHQACAAHGWSMPPGFTLRRQVARLPEKPDFAGELLAYHYGTRYEGRPADAHTEKLLTRRIRAWQTENSGINHKPPASHPQP